MRAQPKLFAAAVADPNGACRSCIHCGAGKFNPVEGADVEQACISCPGGKVSRTVGQGRVACDVCSAGKYRPMGAVSPDVGDGCLSCEAGQYTDVSAQASCFECGAGKISGTESTTCFWDPAFVAVLLLVGVVVVIGGGLAAAKAKAKAGQESAPVVAATVVADEVDNPVFTTDATAPQPEPEAQPTLGEFLTDLNLEHYTDALGELGVAKIGHIADLDKVRTDKRIGPASLTFICAAGRFGERRNESG